MKKKMLQVAIARAETYVGLEIEVNDKLKEIQTNGYPIMDIKFMGYSEDTGATRAMIVFEDEIEAEEEAGN